MVAVALARGSELVRSLIGAISTVQAAAAIYALVALRDVEAEGIWTLGMAVLILWLLYGSESTQEFFAR